MPTKKKRSRTTQSVAITVPADPLNPFAYNPFSMRINKKDHRGIKWTCDHPFVVQFMLFSPLKKVRIESLPGKNKNILHRRKLIPMPGPAFTSMLCSLL